jgi:hypothetical protein
MVDYEILPFALAGLAVFIGIGALIGYWRDTRNGN